MDLSFATLLQMVRFTLQNPREGARMVMQAQLPMGARWAVLALMAIGSALLAHLSLRLMPPLAQQEMSPVLGSPFASAFMQMGVMLLAVQAVYWVGRWRGGLGQFADALVLMGWLQFILLLLQVVQVVAQLIFPLLSVVIGYASIGLFLWLFSNFIAELHGFRSVALVFFGIMATMVAFGVVTALVLLPMMGM